MEDMMGALLGVLIALLVVILILYIVQGIILNKLNKLIYGKGTPMAWIPVLNIYLLGKLTVNKIVGWVLVVCIFLTASSTTTVNGVETTSAILPDGIRQGFTSIYGLVTFILFIYAIVKMRKLKNEGGTAQEFANNNVKQDVQNNNVQPVQAETVTTPVAEEVNVQSTPSVLEQPMKDVQPINVEQQTTINQNDTTVIPVVEQPIVQEANNIEVQSAPIEQPVQVETTVTPVIEPALEQPLVEIEPISMEQSVVTPTVQETNNVEVQAVSVEPVLEQPVVNVQPMNVEQQTTINQSDTTVIPVVEQPIVQETNNIEVQSAPIEQPVQAETTVTRVVEPALEQPLVETQPVTIEQPVVTPIVQETNNTEVQAVPVEPVLEQPVQPEIQSIDSLMNQPLINDEQKTLNENV